MVGRRRRRDHDGVTTRPRALAWTLYALTLASVLPLAPIYAGANEMPEGACSGIGWGCSLYGWDAVGFALLIVGIPYALGLALLLGVLCLLPDRIAPIVTVVAAIGLAVPWVLVLLAAASA